MTSETQPCVARHCLHRLSSRLAREKAEMVACLSEPALRELVTRMRMDVARATQGPAEAETESTTVAATATPDASADAATEATPESRPAPAPAADELTALTLWVSAEFRAELAAV